MLNRILVAVDGSSLSERSLPYAAWLSARSGARLVFLRATSAEWPEQPLQDDVEALVQRAGRQHARAEARVYSVFHEDMPRAIIEGAVANRADLIAMSTHGRGGLGRWIYGSVADRVLRESHLPLLMIPAACEWLWPSDRPLRLLLTLDGSSLAELAIPRAVELTQAVGGELTLLQIVHRPPFAPRFHAEDARASARRYLDDTAARLPVPVHAYEAYIETREVAEAIATFARERGIDLIVMATHGRSGVSRLAMGSVATAALQQAATPMLLVRPAMVAEEAPDTDAAPRKHSMVVI